ncbi:MAG: hypothetical protein J6V52_05320 [Bacteroidaceae bacterium]|nr:hypothetical protein [Bacteroidaceae bacterium]
MRLIDADAAKKALVGWETDPTDEEIERTIDHISTIEAEPVRYGEWVSTALVDQKGRVIVEQYKCSLCGRHEYRKEPYCHCGAKMDGATNGV